MARIAATAVLVRRVLVRRPWIYWSFVLLAALGAAGSMANRADRIDAARDAWGEVRTVFVATVDHAAGDAVAAEPRDVPAAIVADGAATEIAGMIARQGIGAGEIIHAIDLVAPNGPQAMTPTGWLAVPIAESPSSGARIGDRVEVVSDGFVISADGLVVGSHDGVTLVAVPAEEAPSLPVAAGSGGLTLLLKP